MPILRLFAPILMIRFAGLIKRSKRFFALSREKAKRRLAQSNSRDDFFSHVLSEKGSHVSEQFLMTQAQTLIVAGAETTTTLLSGATFWLMKNSRAMHRLVEEVRMFKSSEEITASSTAQLQYLSAVLEEALRIFNPAPFGLPRICPGAEIAGEYIPAGVVVSTSPWVTAHDPQNWHDPDGFHPERWLSGNHKYHDSVFDNDLKKSSKPFSLGLRACLGIGLAYMETRMILAKCKYLSFCTLLLLSPWKMR
jgi:cytochrome P450